MPYGFYITDKGRELIDQAIPNEKKVNIVKACYGNGGNPETERDYSITELKSQFYEKTLSPETDAYQVDENDPYSLFLKSVVPDEVTGTFNEVGYKDDQDNLIIYGVVQERNKVAGQGGGMFRLQYENWVRLENGDVDKIEVTIKTPEYEKVEQLLEQAEKEFDISNYVQKEAGKGLVSTEDVQQITTNKTEIESLKTGKVDKEPGKGLIEDSEKEQITTNKTDIATLKTGKVDKVEGSSLATSAQLTQIETNKTSIETIQGQLEGVETTLSGLSTRMGEVV